MKLSHLSLFLVALAGCGEETYVQINCVTTTVPAVECTVQQTKGKGEVEACWDFSVTCGNGEVVKAERTCQKVKDGGSVVATIPKEKLSNLEKCGGDQPPVAKVENLTLNGKASTK